MALFTRLDRHLANFACLPARVLGMLALLAGVILSAGAVQAAHFPEDEAAHDPAALCMQAGPADAQLDAADPDDAGASGGEIALALRGFVLRRAAVPARGLLPLTVSVSASLPRGPPDQIPERIFTL